MDTIDVMYLPVPSNMAGCWGIPELAMDVRVVCHQNSQVENQIGRAAHFFRWQLGLLGWIEEIF